jgi:subtilisin family serine protease
MSQVKKRIFKIYSITLVCILQATFLLAQDQVKAKQNWQNMDLKTDGLFGMSTEKAYVQLLKDKHPVHVTVAVIDGGVDIDHINLKGAIWTNPKEIPNNGKDDDGNGYIDDIHGWNFLGTSKGSFHKDNKEIVRLLRSALKKDSTSSEALALKKEVSDKKMALVNAVKTMAEQINILAQIKRKIGKESPSLDELKNYRYHTAAESKVLVMVVKGLQKDPEFIKNFEDRYQLYQNQINYLINIDYDPRAGNPEFQKKFHGNGDVKSLEPTHGTHVAGIIAAIPNNGNGVQGVAKEAKIMSIIAIPDGDSVDEDVAGAILYAVYNGAKVINISANKDLSPGRNMVDEAVQYAMKNDVLIIHAGGNDGIDADDKPRYPSRKYQNGGTAEAWIEVGASASIDNEFLMPWFSNYGKTIDVFAPGSDIYSTYPNNSYLYANGTSMAAPMVSGLAAIIRAYYPNLSAIEVKKIIMDSVVKVNHQVKTNTGTMLDFSSVCSSGGIVNIYNALLLAGKRSLLKP